MLENYKKFEGNMKEVIDEVMLAEEDDIGRFVHDYIIPLINEGSLKRYPVSDFY